ncbi:MAG: DUF4129 domain-containing protein [Euryarchaeota archaeon]|nr:DUF4129 domain-containing protein [Euryarchaeota archaeon]
MPVGPAASRTAQAPIEVARDRPGPMAVARAGFGLILVLIVVLAGLAFVNSFFLEPPAPRGPQQPSQQDSGGSDSGGGKTCKDFIPILQWTFFILAGLTVTFFGLAVALRHRFQNRIATSVWGVLAIIGFFFSLLALGAWRLVNFFCNENVDCVNTSNGAHDIFLLLLSLTLLTIAAGIFFAMKMRRNFFLTGWGIIGVVLYVPAILSGFAWYIIRVLCNPPLSCIAAQQARQNFLDVLAATGWWSLLVAVVAFGIGYLVQRRFKFNMFASGWAVVGILALLLAGFSYFGHEYVQGLRIPYCEYTPEEETQNDTERTCEETKAGLQKQLKTILFWILSIAVLSGGGFWFYRDRPKKFFSSPFAIVIYIALALSLLVFLLLLLSNSMCPGDEGENTGDDGDGNIGNGNQGRPGQGGGGGGGGGGPGGGGGFGGIGGAPVAPPIPLDPTVLLWVLAIVGALVLGAILYMALKKRKEVLDKQAAALPQPEIPPAERAGLMRILKQPDLTSKEAIIAAYRSFLAWGSAHGLDKKSHETPLEHAARVREAYPVPERAMYSFVLAYEVARLADRQPTPEERRTAVKFTQEIDSMSREAGGPA